MDRKNRTQDELRRNVAAAYVAAADAAAAYVAASAVAAADAAAAYAASKYAVFSAYDSIYSANYATFAVSAEHWLNEYFKITGENKHDYIDAIEASK